MNIISPVLGFIGWRDSLRFEESTKNPEQTQNKLLQKMLASGENTVFGKEHHFSTITSGEDFQRKVPVSSYEEFRPYIKRIISGEKRILTGEDPIFFATTSGTTGEPKFIPVTRSSRNMKSHVMRLWLYYASRRHPNLFAGKTITVVSPEDEFHTETGIPCGAESGHAYRNMPSVMKPIYTAPYEVFAIKDYALKYYVLLRLALQENITFFAACNPSTIIFLCQKMTELGEDIIRDIHDGSCSGLEHLSREHADAIAPYLRKKTERARTLRAIMDKHGGLTPRHVWPELALIGCWKGGSVGIYLRDFPRYFDNLTPCRDWGYLASEIRGSLPLSDEGSSGVLTIETNYYEFVGEGEIENGNRKFLRAHELREGERYYVFPTTIGGLYRYDMNDIIEVTGFYNRTPLVRFCQKGKGVSSITGEKLYELQVVEAVQQALEEAGLLLEFIVFTVQMDNVPRYVCIVEERDESLAAEKAVAFIGDIDGNLRRLNVEYDSKRASGRLGQPVLKIAARGEYEKFRKKRVFQGVPDGQFKMLKLTPDFEFQKNFVIEREFMTEGEG